MPTTDKPKTGLKAALGNNRSRVAAALTATLVALTYVVCDIFNIDRGIADKVSTAFIPLGVAYILGNGYYETQTAVLDKIPDPPK